MCVLIVYPHDSLDTFRTMMGLEHLDPLISKYNQSRLKLQLLQVARCRRDGNSGYDSCSSLVDLIVARGPVLHELQPPVYHSCHLSYSLFLYQLLPTSTSRTPEVLVTAETLSILETADW